MQTAAASGTLDREASQEATMPANRERRQRTVRRRGTLEQGFALETLGHAVEYLIDSRLFTPSDAHAQSDQEAIQLLMRMSRAVFAECPEVVPLGRRFSLRVSREWQRMRAGLTTDRA